jgi:hypothetical protein
MSQKSSGFNLVILRKLFMYILDLRCGKRTKRPRLADGLVAYTMRHFVKKYSSNPLIRKVIKIPKLFQLQTVAIAQAMGAVTRPRNRGIIPRACGFKVPRRSAS